MRLFDFIVWLLGPRYFGGGGGGGSSQFKAQGAPPSFDYQTAMGLNQLAIGGDIQSYALSDQDFANRYPELQKAYNQYQANMNQQVGLVGQGQKQQSQLMTGLGQMIGGRMNTPTTQNIQNISNAAATAGRAVQPIYNLGAQQAGYAQPITNIGTNITGAGQQVMGAAQTPYQLGQQLLNEPIDPQTQQQMMRAGLGSAAGALGAASLGQGMAGQSAAARQLGLNTLQYGQQMRGEAMQDINQYSSMMGAGAQMQGLGAQTMGLGSSQLGAGAQTMGLGAQTAGLSGQLYGQAQQAQEQYQMDTGQLSQIFGGMQNLQATNMLGNIANSGQLFAKRPFGLGGTNLANADLSQTGAYNSFQQANYATMNGIAFNQAQMNAQQQQLQAQQNASMTGALVSTGATAASTAAMVSAMTCCVARAVYGIRDNRWKVFRHWLMNKAPSWARSAYMRFGQAVASRVERSSLVRSGLKLLMDQIIKRTVYVQC